MRAQYADPQNASVNLWFDEFSVRPEIPLDARDVVLFLDKGGVIEPYEKEPAPAPVVPSLLTRRQFFLQLELSGLTEKVASWVSGQPKLLQIAFRESGSFKRDEPAMMAGFAALGFAADQIDAFFEAGARL